ncbi:type II toxin-antitoxin system PrlF family antitoxin [Thermomonas fusca]|uniref:Type II toxin-antitoxin system PrlF family antitoxin n=1 Tax=Thermomonas fusca TaxID=215690 RepID=A0A5R9PEA4_9GAMM|nr:type II toxin-antitoxin system PrlF family antitoxin [Thermomonas fusca]TLX21363.1 type II toxin-antitoxin system PrlF family antitoxin [Thermomonas fusca]
MTNQLEVESTLTDRYQTTVPETVRRALGLGKRDRIHYAIRAGGEVVLTRAAPGHAEDPALSPFLDLLARDISAHPKRLATPGAALVQHLQSLVAGIDVDLDAPLPADDE